MITLEELIRKQIEFDSCHSSKFEWSQKITNDNVDILEHVMISMVGEFGEAANLVKKVVRGDYSLDDIKDSLSEEIIDILIYVLKLIYQLDIDVEKVYTRKMDQNKERFLKYSKQNDNDEYH